MEVTEQQNQNIGDNQNIADDDSYISKGNLGLFISQQSGLGNLSLVLAEGAGDHTSEAAELGGRGHGLGVGYRGVWGICGVRRDEKG